MLYSGGMLRSFKIHAPQRTGGDYAIFWGLNEGHRFNLMPNVLKIAEKTHQSAQKKLNYFSYI
jgi:hypothetical protein